MSYATIEDLKLRVSDVFQRLYVKLDGSPMDAEALSDLESAQAEIDGMIGTRYRVPVTSGSSLPLLKNWTVTLAEALAWARSGKSETPKNVADRSALVRKSLERIADGSMILSGAVQDETEGGGSIALIDGNDPVFGRDKMRGY